MELVLAVASIALGYLSGSVSFSIVVTRMVRGEDIRKMGNKNAGTANVGRILGSGWGAVVFLGDVGKAVVPMAVARALFPDSGVWHQLVVTLAGVGAIIGHQRPLYFGFSGGSGIATTFGCVGFVAPVELFISMLAGFVVVQIFVRATEYRYGRWTSGAILLLIPLIVALSAITLDLRIFELVDVGGYYWYEVSSVFVFVAVAIVSNFALFSNYLRKLSSE